MSGESRRTVLVLVLIALLVIACGWTWSRYAAAQHRMRQTAEDTARCRVLAVRIDEARRRHTLAQAEQSADMPLMQTVIQDASQRVGFAPESHILNMQSDTGRPLKGTPYLQGSTELRVDGLTREQFVRFLHHLVSDRPGLRVERMDLTFDSDQVAADPLVLTYLTLP